MLRERVPVGQKTDRPVCPAPAAGGHQLAVKAATAPRLAVSADQLPGAASDVSSIAPASGDRDPPG